MGVALFIALSLFQIILLLFVDNNKNIKYGRLIVFVIFLLVYIFLLPALFYPEFSDKDKFRCGMPLMAMYFAFWVIGIGLTILIQFFYFLCNKVKIIN
jgi:uncharacterized membrane protein YozB (DUF420 family)